MELVYFGSNVMLDCLIMLFLELMVIWIKIDSDGCFVNFFKILGKKIELKNI